MGENSVLDGLQYEASGGRLSYKGVRYLLIRPETLVAFQLAVEAEVGPEKCAELMQAGGFTGGALSARRYRDVFGYSDRETAEFMCRMGSEIGWGHFTLVRLDVAGREMIVEVVGSPFAEAYRALRPLTEQGSRAIAAFVEEHTLEASTPPLPHRGGEGVCHFIRGVLAGLGAGLFGGEVVSAETTCQARDAPLCRFEVRGT